MPHYVKADKETGDTGDALAKFDLNAYLGKGANILALLWRIVGFHPAVRRRRCLSVDIWPFCDVRSITGAGSQPEFPVIGLVLCGRLSCDVVDTERKHGYRILFQFFNLNH